MCRKEPTVDLRGAIWRTLHKAHGLEEVQVLEVEEVLVLEVEEVLVLEVEEVRVLEVEEVRGGQS